MSHLNLPCFQSEEEAFFFVEAHLWADGRVCPHCGVVDESKPLKGKTTRVGLYKCYACRKPFTVRMGTIFESSHLKLHLWLQAIFLMVSSKKGISANQMHRTLGITLKSAWFLCHRIREAMREGELLPLGGDVEADETYFGQKEETPTHKTSGKPFIHKGGGPARKRAIVSLVQRGGSVRSFHVDRADQATVSAICAQNISREARLMTDESKLYGEAGKAQDGGHERVKHNAGEYVRGDAYTNTVEGYFSIFKRGMKGVYQHCKEKHLHRYLAEYDFRYNAREAVGVNDSARTKKALAGVVGKRLKYTSLKVAH